MIAKINNNQVYIVVFARKGTKININVFNAESMFISNVMIPIYLILIRKIMHVLIVGEF